MRDSALKRSEDPSQTRSKKVGEELMRDSALKLVQNAAEAGASMELGAVAVSEKSSCATAL